MRVPTCLTSENEHFPFTMAGRHSEGGKNRSANSHRVTWDAANEGIRYSNVMSACLQIERSNVAATSTRHTTNKRGTLPESKPSWKYRNGRSLNSFSCYWSRKNLFAPPISSFSIWGATWRVEEKRNSNSLWARRVWYLKIHKIISSALDMMEKEVGSRWVLKLFPLPRFFCRFSHEIHQMCSSFPIGLLFKGNKIERSRRWSQWSHHEGADWREKM